MPFIEVIFNSQDLALSVTSERVNEILELVNIWFLNIKRATVSHLETLFYCFMCAFQLHIYCSSFELVAFNSREAVCSASSISYNKGPGVMETVFESFNSISMMLFED